jgi:hypothetical protein
MPGPAIATGTVTSPIVVTLPLRVRLVSRSTDGPVLTLVVACKNGLASDVCSGPITLTATGGQKVGNGSYSAASGMQSTVTIPLDSAGLHLLSKSYKLTATLSLAGTTTLTRTVHFHYPRITAPIASLWAFTRFYTIVQELAVSEMPAGGRVEAICHGGGCPFVSKSFPPTTSGIVNLEPSLNGVHLRPHVRLEIEITDTNEVGKVAIATIESGAEPSIVEKCLLPGATSPSHCA